MRSSTAFLLLPEKTFLLQSTGLVSHIFVSVENMIFLTIAYIIQMVLMREEKKCMR